MMTNTLFQRLVLAGVLACGSVGVWGVVGMWAVQTGTHIAGLDQGHPGLRFLADGTPRVARWQEGQWEHWDLEGNMVPPPPENGGVLYCRQLPATLPDGAGFGKTSWNQGIRSFTDDRSPTVYWYLVWDGQFDGTAYFVGYDSKSRGRVGFLGTAGFRKEALPREELIPFGDTVRGPTESVLCLQSPYGRAGAVAYAEPVERALHGSVSHWDVYLIGRGGRIYHADLQKRTVDLVLEEPSLCSGELVNDSSDAARGALRLVARTNEAILVLDRRGQPLKRYPMPEPLRGRDIDFAQTSAGDALMYCNTGLDSLSTRVDYQIYWVTPDGRFRQAEVSLPTYGDIRPLRALGGVVMPAPLVLGSLLVSVVPGTMLEQGRHAKTYEAAVRRILIEFWPAMVIAQLLAAVLAILCYRRQVHYMASGRERLVWPLFVLALGLPGWVAYRFGQSWSVLEACPECGASVPRDRGECAHCEADFPGPVLKGTEVFA